MPPVPPGKPPLGTEARSEQLMQLVRLKQRLLREWAEKYATGA